MIVFLAVTLFCCIASFIADSKRTKAGLKKGVAMFLGILPIILLVLICISIILFFLPNETIVRYLGEDAGVVGYATAALLGAIVLIPGFVAYPLAGVLVKSGVSYPVIAVFITTLMMVGVLTLPIESKFFGLKVALVRNAVFFIAALLVGGAMGVLYAYVL